MQTSDLQTADYCREIEKYLTQKNDGHLIRIAGPSFDLVTRWAAQGVPLKVALRGIDRYFERYYAKGSRRRPVRIDFCEADVLDVFDEWRRAVGLTGDSRQSTVDSQQSTVNNRQSLPEHLERRFAHRTSHSFGKQRLQHRHQRSVESRVEQPSAELSATCNPVLADS